MKNESSDRGALEALLRGLAVRDCSMSHALDHAEEVVRLMKKILHDEGKKGLVKLR